MTNISPVGSFTCNTTDFNGKATTADVQVGTRGATIKFADSDAASIRYVQHMSNSAPGEPQPKDLHLATLTIDGLPFDNANKSASSVEAARKVLSDCRAKAPAALAAQLERYENAATPGTKLAPPPPTGLLAALPTPQTVGARFSEAVARLNGKPR